MSQSTSILHTETQLKKEFLQLNCCECLCESCLPQELERYNNKHEFFSEVRVPSLCGPPLSQAEEEALLPIPRLLNFRVTMNWSSTLECPSLAGQDPIKQIYVHHSGFWRP